MLIEPRFEWGTYITGIGAWTTWSLEWTIVCVVAIDRAVMATSVMAVCVATTSLIITTVAWWWTVPQWRTTPNVFLENTEDEHRSLVGRAIGWFAAAVWSAAAVIWNVTTTAALIQSAESANLVTVLILIPFSLIGLFFLLVLYAGVGVVIEWALKALGVISP
ncbi:MAG: hypothetical protein AAGB29_04400 [Planctomycetota bacterium]